MTDIPIGICPNVASASSSLLQLLLQLPASAV